MGQSLWVGERLEKVKQLAARGLTIRQIAEAMRVTKNAVVGICDRQGIQVYKKPTKPKKEAVDKPVSVVSHETQPYKKGVKFSTDRKIYAPSSIELPVLVLPGEPIKLLYVKEGQCRWPLGKRDGHNVCCGKSVLEGRPYCLEHCALSYQPLKPNVPHVMKKYWSGF